MRLQFHAPWLNQILCGITCSISLAFAEDPHMNINPVVAETSIQIPARSELPWAGSTCSVLATVRVDKPELHAEVRTIASDLKVLETIIPGRKVVKLLDGTRTDASTGSVTIRLKGAASEVTKIDDAKKQNLNLDVRCQ